MRFNLLNHDRATVIIPRTYEKGGISMQEAGGPSMQMLPLWFQWLFAGGSIALIVAGFVAFWTKVAKIEKRIGRLQGRSTELSPEEETPS